MDKSGPQDPATIHPRHTREGATCGALAALDLESGWLVLRNCPLGGGPRISFVLLHPCVGIALVDFSPKATDAVGRLRRALDERRFAAIFGGYPPVARAVLPADRVLDLGHVLSAAFEAQPPLALGGGDAWVRTARAAIEAEQPVAAPEPLRARRRNASPCCALALTVVTAITLGAPTAMMVWQNGFGRAARSTFMAASVPETALSAPAFPEGSASATVVSRPQQAESAPAAMAVADEERPKPLPTLAAAVLIAAVPVPVAAPATTVVAPTGLDSRQHSSTPLLGSAAAKETISERRSLPKRAPALLNAMPQLASRPAVTGSRRTVLPTSARPASEVESGGRCRDILVRATVGGELSDDDRSYLRRGCQPRG